MERNPAEPARDDDLTGEALAGHYLVTERTYSSGGRTQYRGCTTDGKRNVDITVFPPEVGRAEADARAFAAQVRTLKELSHPGIPDLLEGGVTDDGRRFLVHTRVEGRSLRDLLKAEAPLGPDRAAALLMKIARVLSAARSGGVMHGNLKPEAIRLVVSDRDLEAVAIPDMGVAKLGRLRPGARGVVTGTPHYMSPEQATGTADEPRSDVYALGVMAFEMLTGRVPFPGSDDAAVLKAHVEATPPRLTEVDPHNTASPMFQQLLDRMLARKPEARPSHAALLEEFAILPEFLDDGGGGGANALGGIPRDDHGGAGSISFGTRGPDSSELPRPAAPGGGVPSWALAVAGLLVLGAAGAFLAQRAPEPAAPPPPPPAAPAPAAPAPAPRDSRVVVDMDGLRMRPRAKAAPVPAPAAARPAAEVPAGATSGLLVTIHVTSDPPGAAVFEGAIPRGTTPAQVVLPRGDSPRVLSFRLDGYDDVVRTVVPNAGADLKVVLQKKAAAVPPQEPPAPAATEPARVEPPKPAVPAAAAEPPAKAPAADPKPEPARAKETEPKPAEDKPPAPEEKAAAPEPDKQPAEPAPAVEAAP
ncbi:MAG: serine/threonine protein kinase [Deltaproteobacteria bacterium]|nr:serine/threonine protein kinase [Deltaproteobacteria bacterium]